MLVYQLTYTILLSNAFFFHRIVMGKYLYIKMEWETNWFFNTSE